MLPDSMRFELATELQTTIDNLTAEHVAALIAVKAEAARAYEPVIAGLRQQVGLLEALARDQGDELAQLDLFIGVGLGAVFVLGLVIDPDWGDVIPAAATAAWFAWRYWPDAPS